MRKYMNSEKNADFPKPTHETNISEPQFHKDILFGQTIENFQNRNIQDNDSSESKKNEMNVLLKLFPQLKNLDQHQLLALLQQQNNSSSLDTEGRVLYNQTIQSFYKDNAHGPTRAGHDNASAMDSNLFSNEYNTAEQPHIFANQGGFSHFDRGDDFFPQPK
jgi:hypothetical protein